jgi:hypothetical protein
MFVAAPAIPVKPRTAAISAMIKAKIAVLSIEFLLRIPPTAGV